MSSSSSSSSMWGLRRDPAAPSGRGFGELLGCRRGPFCGGEPSEVVKDGGLKIRSSWILMLSWPLEMLAKVKHSF